LCASAANEGYARDQGAHDKVNHFALIRLRTRAAPLRHRGDCHRAMTSSGRRSRTQLVLWIIVTGAITLGLLVILVTSAVNAAILVDQVPGGDAGLATTPALETAYRTMGWSFSALVAVVAVGVGGPFLVTFTRARRTAFHQVSR
jgi:hypothetical protein